MEMNGQSNSSADGRVAIPDSQPKPEKTPAYKVDFPNYADNKETAHMAVQWIKAFYSDFEDQDAWQKFMSNMDAADEMMRAAVNRVQLSSDESSNTESTRSNVKSSTYHSELNIISSGEMAIMLDKENQLPVVYEPMPDSSEYNPELGKMLAEERNAILSYTIEKSNMRDDIRRWIWRNNKYGNAAIEMQWDYRKAERTVKVPTQHEEIEMPDGTIVQKPVKFKKQKKTVTIADHPKLIVHDMANVRFDAMIEDMQNQSCIVLRTQKQLGDLWAEQLTGKYKNVGDITSDQLYSDEGRDSVLKNRQDNAGEGSDVDKPTTLFDVYYGWVRVPINDDTGEWDATTQIAHWYEYIMVGNIDKSPVLVKLTPLTHSSGQIPFKVTHALEDDKGAIHVGYAELVKSNIAQEMTSLDQAIDNNTLRNRKTWIIERNSINIRDMVFSAGGNQIFWKKPGTEDPKEIDVQDTTQTTQSMLAYLEADRRKILGTNKPLSGEALGGRTSAAESIAVFEQALKPALESAKYKANQIFPFIAFWVPEMWKDFGDPALVINLTGKSPVKQVKPADIYGDMRVRVTAIKQFQDGILRRKEEDNFISQFLPILIQNRVMTPTDLARFAKETLLNRGIENVDDYISVKSNADAQHVAKAENNNIVFHGVLDLPQPEEDHQTHLDEHLPFAASASLAFDKDHPYHANIKNLQLHIQQHQQMMQSTQSAPQGMPQGLQAGQNQLPQEGNPPRTEGEAFGDMAGGLENPEGMQV